MEVTMTTDIRFLLKIMLVGGRGVGKTSLLDRFTDDVFIAEDVRAGLIDIKAHIVDLGGDYGRINLQIWDTSGKECVRCNVLDCFRGIDGLAVVFDLTDKSSFEQVTEWLAEADRYQSWVRTRLLVGNKLDLKTERVIATEMAQALADELRMPYVETSAKDNTNVDHVFTSLGKATLRAKRENYPKGNINVPRDEPRTENQTQWKCVCS